MEKKLIRASLVLCNIILRFLNILLEKEGYKQEEHSSKCSKLGKNNFSLLIFLKSQYNN